MATKEEKPSVSIDTQKLDDWNSKFFQLDRRMARKLAFEKKQFIDKRNQEKGKDKVDESMEKPLDPRMARKLDFEEKEHQKRQGQEKGDVPTGTKVDSMPSLPWPRKKEIDENINKVKQLPVEERKPKWEQELKALDETGKKLIADTKLSNEEKKPIALDFKTGKETIQKEMANDVNEIKQLKIDRKKQITDQLESIKGTMSQVEKVPSDKGEVTQAITAYQASKSTLLKLLSQDMTAENTSKADTLVKKLKVDAERVLAVNKTKQDRIGASKQIVNKLGANIVPDENGSFPTGGAKTLGKAVDRTIGGQGPLFKPVIKALEEVEKSPVEKNLNTLEIAAKNYLTDYDRRVKEGQDSGKPFKPDKITTQKAQACRDAIEKVRKLRVARDIQGEMGKLPKDPRSPEEEQQLNRLKAKVMIESGGAKQLDSSESGASESFFLSDPTDNKKGFIFKPNDGEFGGGYGWEKGGGAPREVALSSVNEAFKNSIGLDCGVSQTTLVSVDSPTVATDRNGKNSKRVGAIQNFVAADKGLSNKLNPDKQDEYDKNFINTVPPEEIEKVAILDFCTLQMDRQGSNLLVSQDSQGTPRLTPIDAGNALPSRKAFEASRRQFGNNAVLSGDEAKKPFSKDALDKIAAIDEEEIVGGMKKANTEMSKVDPKSGQAIGDENMEMTRRSIRFLKKAAPLMSKAEIADAYAYLFQTVLDAKPNQVDATIDKVIQDQLAKPGILDELAKDKDAKSKFIALGWPNDEFLELQREDPARLVKILNQKQECPAMNSEIEKMIDEIGRNNLTFDPYSYKSLHDRYTNVKKARDDANYKKKINDPQTAKTMQKLGFEFASIDENGVKKPITTDLRKAWVLDQMDEYIKLGGEEALKKRKINPAKLTPEQKIFEALGGEPAFQELFKQGLTDYDGEKLSVKITDLRAAKEYEALGGEEAYALAGGAQNKTVMLAARVDLLKRKLRAKAT